MCGAAKTWEVIVDRRVVLGNAVDEFVAAG